MLGIGKTSQGIVPRMRAARRKLRIVVRKQPCKMAGFTGVQPPSLTRLGAREAMIEHPLGDEVRRRIGLAPLFGAGHQKRHVRGPGENAQRVHGPVPVAQRRQGADARTGRHAELRYAARGRDQVSRARRPTRRSPGPSGERVAHGPGRRPLPTADSTRRCNTIKAASAAGPVRASWAKQQTSARTQAGACVICCSRIHLVRRGAPEQDRARLPAQIDLTSPPSILSVVPVIQCAPGDTMNAINSAISSGAP